MTLPTNKSVIRRASKHLLKQNKQSLDGSICMYRSPDGTKCAVGCLIPDSLYSNTIERYPVDRILDAHPKLKELFKNVDLELLHRLQQIHDSTPLCKWKDALDALKKRYQ